MVRILFFTPSGFLTGSEVTLYQLISDINRELFIPVGVISVCNGDLLSKFSSNIYTINFQQEHRKIISLVENIKIKVLKQDYYHQFLIKLHQKLKPNIWYINTIVQEDVLKIAQDLNIPCIIHSHELEQMLVNLSSDYIQSLISYPKLIIACSQTAKKVLTTLGRKNNIEVCHPSINTNHLAQLADPNLKSKNRNKFNLPTDAFIWLMSGTIDANKNPVRFLELAKILLSQHQNVYFLWIGSNSELAMYTYLKNYAEQLGVSNHVRWVDSLDRETYYQYFTTVDAFILTSYKESFSIVLLEAMYLGKPIVSLDCSGPSEVLVNSAGTIVNSWDNDNIAHAMNKVMNGEFKYSPKLAKERASIYDTQSQSKRWNQILTEYLIENKHLTFT